MTDTINNDDTQLLKIVFDLKQEFASYKKDTDDKIKNLENIISSQEKELQEERNKNKILIETINTCRKIIIKLSTLCKKNFLI